MGRNPITARGALTSLPDSPPEWIMWMPGGTHEITAERRGKPFTTTVLVDRETAAVMQQTLGSVTAAGPQRPFFDFDHDSGAASAWPVDFAWREQSNTPAGVYAKVVWSKPGADAVTGKSYRAFSPTFFVDDSKPARVTGAPLNMGGLVNDPAFKQIAPLWARDANASTTTAETVTNRMNETELAALKANLQKLERENAELKAKATSSENADALKAKESNIIELRAQLKTAQDAITAQRKKDADTAVKAAVAKGQLPPKDEAIQAKWRSLIEADPENQVLLASLPVPAALAAGAITKPGTKQDRTDVEIKAEDTNDVLLGYLNAGTPKEKGMIYRDGLHARLDQGEVIPFHRLLGRLAKDGDSVKASNTLGTLVGNIISQRTLSLVFSRRPMLKAVVTDLSDEQAKKAQAIYVRTIGLPTVQDFGGTVSETADVDYPVTLSELKEVRFTYLATEYLATNRDLVREHSEALAIALGNHMVDALAALIDDTYTSETVIANASWEYATIATIARTLNVAGIPDMERFAWVNSLVAEALRNDELMALHFNRDNGSAYANWKNVEGFSEVLEYPALPANSVNVTSFWFQKNALLLAARVPAIAASFGGAPYPGRLTTVTDPVTGLSVISNQWVAQDTLAVNDRLITLFGVDEGILAAGHKTVSS